MRTFILILLTFLIPGCKWSNADLGDSYYYLDSYEAYDVGYPYGAIIYKSLHKNLFRQTVISREVVDAHYNDQFIIAKQLAPKNRLDTNFYVTEKEYGKVLQLDTSYFIIDKEKDKVFGPLTLDSYSKLKKTLHVEL